LTRTIELPESDYQDLEQVARERGMSAGDWIASVLPADHDPSEKHGLHEVLRGLVGAINSTDQPRTEYPPTAISDLVCEEMEKQGLRTP
jgi:hypothetical protein